MTFSHLDRVLEDLVAALAHLPERARRTRVRAALLALAEALGRPGLVGDFDRLAREAEPEADAFGPAESLVAYVDGGARGNPGPAACGLVLADGSGKQLLAAGRCIGRATNNEAEYRALLWALEEAEARGARALEVRSDSELVVKQVSGQYAVRHPKMRPLAAEARGLASGFERFTIKHVPREENAEADGLVNDALDRG